MRGVSVARILAALGACALVVALSCAAYIHQNPSVERPADYGADNAGDAMCAVSHDANGNGVSDQCDILQGALDYVRFHPKYGSKYYAGGYPDDGYGVCTDVVAAALRNAGYDLREMVDEDIRQNSDEYDIALADANIDYRRVKNLRAYFSRKWTSLTLDVKDHSAWMGGDVVVFDNHIGVVSDRRNSNGVPYLIHHSGEWQLAYEEDVLENPLYGEIVGHYRIP